MNMIKKRNGEIAPFNPFKIINAINAAARATDTKIEEGFCSSVADIVYEKTMNSTVDIEEIQNIVEESLMKNYPQVAKRYIIYRELRANDREKDTKMLSDVREIIEVESGNLLNDNANINGATPAGQMMKMASLYSKDHALRYLVNPAHAAAHQDGALHIHDLDYYLTKSLTCCQIDLHKLFKDGFDTNDSSIREPKRVKSYAALAAIALQSNQNEMHGGQSIPAFDYYMAEGVRVEFKRQYRKLFRIMQHCNAESFFAESEWYIGNPKLIGDKHRVEDYKWRFVYEEALRETKEQTYQAMESFVFNMVNMHSRG